jgi:hypothetical protein
MTPLHHAVKAAKDRHNYSLIIKLVLKGADIKIKDLKNRTPYEYFEV